MSSNGVNPTRTEEQREALTILRNLIAFPPRGAVPTTNEFRVRLGLTQSELVECVVRACAWLSSQLPDFQEDPILNEVRQKWAAMERQEWRQVVLDLPQWLLRILAVDSWKDVQMVASLLAMDSST